MNKSRYFKYYQPNEKDIKDKYGDCVIRALTKALDKTWLEVFDDLVIIARELQSMPNSKICYETYLKRNGFNYYGISNKKGSKRPTIESFARDHKIGTYYCNVANHCVTIKDNIYYDIWDCGNKSLYGYWTKERGE